MPLRSARIPGRLRFVVIGAGLLLIGAPRTDGTPPHKSRAAINELVERIATGSRQEAATATDELIEQTLDPLSQALQAIDERPRAEQVRLHAALGRLGARLRLRLFRQSLPEQDRILFDAFLAHDKPLVVKLFDDDPRRRIAALNQIPLEPDTGAGVLITAKLYDWDASVVDEALRVAVDLKDEVVARGVERFLTDAIALVCGDQEPGAVDQDMELVLADYSRKGILVLGRAGYRAAVPTIMEAIRCFENRRIRKFFAVSDALVTLGELGDKQAVPLLLDYLNDRRVHAVRSAGVGMLVRQSVGDAALLGLARMYDIDPAALGFFTEMPPVYGFFDDEDRQRAIKAFARWQAAHADKPPEERPPLTTQPAEPDTVAP